MIDFEDTKSLAKARSDRYYAGKFVCLDFLE